MGSGKAKTFFKGRWLFPLGRRSRERLTATFYDVICFGNRLPNVNKPQKEPEDQNTERNHWPKRQVSRSRSLGKFGGLQHHQVAGNGALLGTVLLKVVAIVGS